MGLDCKDGLIDKKLENSFTFLKLHLLRELWRYHALRGSKSQRSAPPPPPWWRIGSLPSVRGSYSPLPPPQVSPTYQNPIIFSALMLWCHPCRGGYMGIWSCEIWFKFWTWQTTVARWQWVAGETIGAGGASSCRSSSGSSRNSRSTTTLTSSTSTLSTYCWWNNGAGQDSSWDWGAACSRHWGWIQPLSLYPWKHNCII